MKDGERGGRDRWRCRREGESVGWREKRRREGVRECVMEREEEGEGGREGREGEGRQCEMEREEKEREGEGESGKKESERDRQCMLIKEWTYVVCILTSA